MRFAFPFHRSFFHIFDDVTSRFCPTLVVFGLFFLGITSNTDSMYRLLLSTLVTSFSWPLHPAPGSQGDISALEQTLLLTLLNTLPLGYFIIGDNAYAPSQHLVPDFWWYLEGSRQGQ
jgi:hypothetical protein